MRYAYLRVKIEQPYIPADEGHQWGAWVDKEGKEIGPVSQIPETALISQDEVVERVMDSLRKRGWELRRKP